MVSGIKKGHPVKSGPRVLTTSRGRRRVAGTDLAIGMGLATTPEYLEGRCDRRKTSPFPRLPRQRPAPLSTLGFFYGGSYGLTRQGHTLGRTGVMHSVVVSAIQLTDRGVLKDPKNWNQRLFKQTYGFVPTHGSGEQHGLRADLTLGIGLALLCPQQPPKSIQMASGLDNQYNHYVYIMKANPSGYVKIGRSKNVESRAAMLSRQTHYALEVVSEFGYNASEDCAMVEKYFHVAYAKHRSDIHSKTEEWFKPEIIGELPTGRLDPEKCKFWLIRYYPGFSNRFKRVWLNENKRWVWIARRPYK